MSYIIALNLDRSIGFYTIADRSLLHNIILREMDFIVVLLQYSILVLH